VRQNSVLKRPYLQGSTSRTEPSLELRSGRYELRGRGERGEIKEKVKREGTGRMRLKCNGEGGGGLRTVQIFPAGTIRVLTIVYFTIAGTTIASRFLRNSLHQIHSHIPNTVRKFTAILHTSRRNSAHIPTCTAQKCSPGLGTLNDIE
jgi:hypothetical protein